jgi:hypothetical protein
MFDGIYSVRKGVSQDDVAMWHPVPKIEDELVRVESDLEARWVALSPPRLHGGGTRCAAGVLGSLAASLLEGLARRPLLLSRAALTNSALSAVALHMGMPGFQGCASSSIQGYDWLAWLRRSQETAAADVQPGES